jgi:hypothetical protein
MPIAFDQKVPCVVVWLSAGDRHSGLRDSELRADHVDDALFHHVRQVELDAELPAVALERDGHFLGHQVEERPLLRARRDDVIDGRDGALGEGHLEAGLPQHVERLRARDFMNQVEADEQLRLPARERPHLVRVPHLVKSVSAM